MVEVLATAFVAGFVAIAVLGHLLVVVALLPRSERRLRLQPQT